MNKAYFPIGAYYFFYFAILGALVPYLGLYLKALDYSANEIGELIALLSITKIISPNLSSWIADRFGVNMRLVRIASFLALCCFSFIFFRQDYWGLFLIIAGFSFFWNASLPQFEVNTLDHLGVDNMKHYSRIRVWGSIGFILCVFLSGILIEEKTVQVLPHIILLLFILLWLSSLLVSEAKQHAHQPQAEGFWQIIRQREVIILLLVIFLIQLSHGAYYSFFSLFLQEHHYSKALTGILWSVSVIAEVFVFLSMGWLIKRFGIKSIFAFSLLATSVRWLLLAAFVSSPAVVFLAQLLHAASFGVFHIACVAIISVYFAAGHKSKGQALYVSIGFGLGGASGSYLAGLLWDRMGGQQVFFVFALFAFLAVYLFYRWGDFKKL